METSPASNGNQPRPAAPAPAHDSDWSGSLDDLLALAPAELAALYRAARVPRLADVEGDLRGRMLAVEKLMPPLSTLVRALASSNRFPWRGKTFQPLSNSTGEGVNRVVTDSFHLFRFTTFVGPSRAGAFDAVQLDYDHPHNPFFIRAIKDEIRELAPGLWLGQAYAQIKDRAHLVLHFGLAK